MKKHLKWVAAALACTMIVSIPVTPVSATKMNDVKNKKEQSQKGLNNTKGKINKLQKNQSAVNNELSAMDAELVELVTSISALEQDLKDTEKKLNASKKEYDKVKKEEEQQYEDMKERIKYLYEKGDAGYLAAFLKAESFTDMINKVEYAQQLYDTDSELLDKYQSTKKKVAATYKSVQDEKASLEEAKAQCADQKKTLQATIASKKQESADFADQLLKAEKEAKAYEAAIANAKTEEARLQAIERQRAAVARRVASSNNSNSGNTSAGGSSGGSTGGYVNPGVQKPSDASLGQQIVNYATNFIGRPYVYGGTSLTTGIDCSAFTQQMFAHFGIGLPRTSGAQRSAGFEVPYSEARPGDLICYSGHVAIYMGGGQIIHASNSAPYPAGGVKTSPNAQYRQILSVRRCY